MSIRSRRFLQLGTALVIGALLLRISELYNAFEYDELWSLHNYSGLSPWQILTDLGLPNNHPLNSLWMKLMAWSNSRPLLRLHSLIAGIGTVIAGGGFALYYFRSRKAALWTMACLACSSPLIAYSQSARGYSMQVFFITLFAWCVMAMQPRFRSRKFRYLPECGLVISGIAAVWSVSSSALFLFPVSLLALWRVFRRWKNGERPMPELVALGVFGLFALCWYGALFQVMRGAQVWATPVTGVRMYLTGVAGIIWQLGFSLVLFLLLTGFRKNRAIAVSAAFPLLGAIGTNLAGARVYLAMVPAFAAMTAYAAVRFRKCGWVLPTLFFAFSCLQRPVWQAVDWYELFADAVRQPQEYITVYTATAGYPVSENHGDAAKKDFVQRLLAHENTPRRLLLIGSDALNGVDDKGCETVIAPVKGTRLKIGSLDSTLVELSPLRQVPAAGDLLLAAIPPVPDPTEAILTSRLCQTGRMWRLNGWLTVELTQRGRTYHYGLLAVRVTHPEAFSPELLKFPPSMISLYRVEEAK